MPYIKPEKLGSFRRFALAFWDKPRDGSIYGTMFLDATNMLAMAKKIEEEHGVKVSPGIFVGKGLALGMRAAPQFNSKIIWGKPYYKDTVDMYFQVDVDKGKDLSGVVVERADEKSVVEIAKELRDKAMSIRSGTDKQYEKTQKGLFSKFPPFLIRKILQFLTFMDFNLGLPLSFLPGVTSDPFGTVMLTNVGMMGIDLAYAPLIPVTRVGVIGLVGRVVDEPMAVAGEIKIRPKLTCGATFDHRLGNGAQIGLLVRTARDFMENPWIESGLPRGVVASYMRSMGGKPPEGTRVMENDPVRTIGPIGCTATQAALPAPAAAAPAPTAAAAPAPAPSPAPAPAEAKVS